MDPPGISDGVYHLSPEGVRRLETHHFTGPFYAQNPQILHALRDDLDMNYLPMLLPPYPITNGSNVLPGPMLHHPATYINCSAQLTGVISLVQNLRREDYPSQPAFDKLQKLLSCWQAANSLKLLNRFLDEGQPRLIRSPSIEGINLEVNQADNPDRSQYLGQEWALRRNFIRFLHYPGLVTGTQTTIDKMAFVTIIRIYAVGRGLLETELDDASTIQGDSYRLRATDPLAAALGWIDDSRKIISNILEDVASIAYAPLPRLVPRAGQDVPPQLSNSRTERNNQFQNNINSSSISLPHIMDQRLDFHLSNHPFERLLLDLLAKEDAFEKALTAEHVEDKLIDKQISLLDENQLTGARAFADLIAAHRGIDGDLDDPDHRPFASPLDSESFLSLERYMLRALGDIALTNRQRRNFRLFRDWCWFRPWLVIYHLYDSRKDGNEWQAEAITRFHNHTTNLPNLETRRTPYRTSYFRVAREVFGFVPADMGDMAFNRIFQDPCGVCTQNFEADQGSRSTVFQLHCPGHHKFHLKCIFDYWDAPGRYLQRCPVCREYPDLNWQRLGLNSRADNFAHNVFSWDIAATVADELNNWRDDNYDRSDMYDVPQANDPQLDARNYHIRENVFALSLLENMDYLPWYSTRFPPGMPASLGPRIGNEYPESVARRTMEAYLDMRFPLPQMAAERAEAVRIDVERLLHRPYHPPQVEAAYLRAVRRRRDAARRRRVANAGQGLGGL